MKNLLLVLPTVIVLFILSSCNSSPDRKIASEQAVADSVAISQPDSLAPETSIDYSANKPPPPPSPPESEQLEELPETSPPKYAEIQLDTLSPRAGYEISEIEPVPVAVDSATGVPYITKDKSYIQKTEGTLVYYCPARMLENTDNNVSVTITKAAMKEAIIQLEKRVAATTGKSAELIHDNITGSSITIASKMKVELKYAEKDFQTIYKPEYDDQIFDGENDMHWDWIIKPTKIGNLQLSIILSAFDEKNGRWIPVQTPPKIFNIKVQVDPRSYLAKLWGFFGDHPEWLLTQFLFPLAAFFYGKRQKAKAA